MIIHERPEKPSRDFFDVPEGYEIIREIDRTDEGGPYVMTIAPKRGTQSPEEIEMYEKRLYDLAERLRIKYARILANCPDPEGALRTLKRLNREIKESGDAEIKLEWLTMMRPYVQY